MLLGKWIPAYQAFDWMSQPSDNIIGMISPLLKSPFEIGFNTSSFWKNSLGNYQDIERYAGEQTSFLGLNSGNSCGIISVKIIPSIFFGKSIVVS